MTGTEFPATTAEQWRRLALAALRRSGNATDRTGPEQVDDLLATVTHGGPRIAALHTADSAVLPPVGLPGQPPYVRGARASGGLVAGWDVRQRYAEAEPEALREAALTDLENGTTSLWVVLGGDALPIDALPDALDGVHLTMAAVFLDSGDGCTDAADAWFDLAAARGLDSRQLSGGLGADPLGWRARTGDRTGLGGALKDTASLATRCVAEAPGVRAITVDASPYHDAGGSDAEELGSAVAAGVAYLRALTGEGLSVAAALSQMEFRFAATVDQFATIAKLRAARRLWARVAEMCGAADAGGQRQHAVTSAAMMTVRDPWVNLLRTTIATFAAGVGGAEAVTVLPFDHQLGRPDALSRRLARNAQTLLVEEAHLARVLDPAGGSWYVEQYTEQLAQAAWEWFTTIERAGGLAAALDSGLVADRLNRTWRLRESGIAHRRDPITGVSEFPNPAEEPPPRRPAAAPANGGLPRRRHAEAFERLRDRSDAHQETTGGRPAVFLAALGAPGGSGPRVTFATNLFAAGGLAVVTGSGADPQAVAAAFVASGTTVACLCGTDKAYVEHADPVVAALRAAGAQRILLAGRGDHPDVDENVHVGCDAVAVLTRTLAELGVPE
ncbi:methylmalonyl-CoA mutase subunit beta [Jidongwangia harbinensis]|uniref:methylmalonyl-CoA mutase subunit beta n=1 Tax=Jidongwangia harbinensis TaxID=2878561 RepID=UPI001CD9AE00|nr:methylmalonyl-CoA mutase family protein [Jidongwangia harbinensis]MCA2217190.1 methylmalonyl-CoA mutase subunit beta [Jidongwangia harbinensis]